MTRHGYVPLGFYRLTLALCVLIAHYYQQIGQSLPVSAGALGVYAFFTLSGYVILAAHDRFYRGALGRFALNRALKIYPLLWMVLAGSTLVLVLGGPVPGDLSLKGYDPTTVTLAVTAILGNLKSETWNVLPIAWSIHVELKFYAVAFVLFLLAERCPPEREALLLGMVAAAFVAAALWVTTNGHGQRFYGEIRFAPFFVLGGCLYQVVENRRPGAAILALTLAAGAACLLEVGKAAPAQVWSNLIFFIVLTLGLALGIRWRVSPFWGQVDKNLGDLTYALYLLHVPVMTFTHHYLPQTQQGGLPLALAACLAAAVLAHHGGERPVSALRDRVRGARLRA